MKLYFLAVALANIYFLAQAGIGESIVDAGGAIDSLRQNNAVVGILYFIVIVQAGVIVKLWLKVNQISNDRITDLKERLNSEEKLRQEIKDIYTKMNSK